MNPRTPRTLTRFYFYLFFIVISLVGLIPATTIISSSHSLDSRAKDAANRTSDRKREAELFYQNDGRRGSGQDSNTLVVASYQHNASPLLRDMKQLFLQPPAAKVASRVLADTADGGSTSVVILLADQADLSAAYDMKDQDARGWFVYNTLTQHAARTQVGLQEFLKSRGATYQSFWAANMLVATADRSLVEQLAARSDVARVDTNMPTRWIEDPKITDFRDAPNRVDAPNAAELGVLNVNAPAVWALGFNGQGMVVGGLDTGIRWTHNALKPKYRGWNGASADHNYNWHDAIHSGGGICGANTVAPCDDNFHGSHTVGTMVGDDGAGNQIGVAPGAKWIGCRNMDQGNGTPATYTECFQFTIAPTDLAGNNPNPALRPHVLNNSWGCPISEGCTTHAELEMIVNNTQAAGIFVAVSAGNDGSACSSISNGTNAGPAAVYEASFSVGAINASNNVLASFSSRGPSLFYNPNLLKPNISAPGVSVRSVTNASDTGYSTASGTSMAGPHVAGVVALLWSARPSLVRNIAATKTLLQDTANPAVTVTPMQTCGGTPSTQIPNNSFGYGRVDALAAVSSGPVITGRVNYQDSATAAKNVTVTLTAPSFTQRQTTTDGNGDYYFTNVPAGNNYTVTPSKSGDVNGLESLDASIVARYVAGIDVPTANQQIAADADGDGLLTSLDASLIARYVAGLPGTGNVGTWKFAAPNHTYTGLSADQANQNFSAILVGDTGGNWTPALPSGGGGNVNRSGQAVLTSGNLASGNVASPDGSLAVTVLLPHVTGPTLTNITIPMTVGDLTGQGVKAYDLQITFDPAIVQPQGTPFDTAGTVSSGMLITPNATNPGHLIISAFQATDLSGSGTLINLKFMIVGAPGQVTPLAFQDYTDPGTIFHPGFRFNAGTPAAVTTNGSCHVNGPTAAAARIRGQIVTAAGQPVGGATVTVLGGAGTIRAITDSTGFYKVENLEAGGFYTVTPSRANYVFTPPNRAFSLVGDKTDAVFTATAIGPDANPLESPEFFVRQQYLDFLGREPDETGFNFWSDQILECGNDTNCIERRRINVSAAYFLSIEFQQTGGLVDGLYRASYARRPLYAEFMPDTGVVANNVIVGRENWAQQLEANKQAFVDAWVQRAVFRAAYDGLSTDAFVATLINHTESGFNGDRNALVSGLNGGTMTRAAVLRQVVENEGFERAKSNQMFVMMEYFGYLRRDPDASGYAFWLNKLSEFNGDFERAEMVKAFIVSGEYRDRFPR